MTIATKGSMDCWQEDHWRLEEALELPCAHWTFVESPEVGKMMIRKRALPYCAAFIVGLLQCAMPAFGQLGLDETWTVVAAGQIARVGSDGNFWIANVTMPDFRAPFGESDDFVRVYAYRVVSGQTELSTEFSYAEPFHLIRGGPNYAGMFSPITTDPPPLEPRRMRLSVCSYEQKGVDCVSVCPSTPCPSEILVGHATLNKTLVVPEVQLVTGGGWQPVQGDENGTSYTTSNRMVATVNESGAVEAQAAGVAFISALYRGMAATVRIQVIGGTLVSTTVEGFVIAANGTPVNGCTVITSTGENATSDTAGHFAITLDDVGSEDGFSVTAICPMTSIGKAAVHGVLPEPDGITDVGYLVLEPIAEATHWAPPDPMAEGSGAWDDPSNWTNGMPDSTKHAIVLYEEFDPNTGPYTITDVSGYMKALTVATPKATLTFPATTEFDIDVTERTLIAAGQILRAHESISSFRWEGAGYFENHGDIVITGGGMFVGKQFANFGIIRIASHFLGPYLQSGAFEVDHLSGLANSGTITVESGTSLTTKQGPLMNQPGGFISTGSGNLTGSAKINVAGTSENNGFIDFATATVIDAPGSFTNRGAMTVLSGDTQFKSGTFIQESGTLTVNDGATFSVVPSNSVFELLGGRVEGEGVIIGASSKLTIAPSANEAARFRFLGYDSDLEGDVQASHSLEVVGTNGPFLTFVQISESLTNNGTIAFIDGPDADPGLLLRVNSPSVLTNGPGGIIEFGVGTGIAHLEGNLMNHGKILVLGSAPDQNTIGHDDGARQVLSDGVIELVAGGRLTYVQHSTGSFEILPNGSIEGNGTIDMRNASELQNGGAMFPGGAGTTGAIAVVGLLRQKSGSVLNLELAPGGFDVVNVDGTITFDNASVISVSLIDGYEPPSGTQFEVINYDNRAGTTIIPTLPTGFSHMWDDVEKALIVSRD